MKRLVCAAVAVVLSPVAPVVAAEARPVTVDDVVQTRRLTDTRISPDGRLVALVVTEPSIEANAVTSRVLVAETAHPDKARQLTELTGTVDRITNLRWTPDGRSLLYLAPPHGADEVWRVPLDGGRPRKALDFDGPAVAFGGENLAFRQANTPPHLAKVLAFEPSPDGRTLAFTTPRPLAAPTTGGVRYDPATMDLRTLESRQFGAVRNGLWLAELDSGATHHVLDSVQGPLAARPRLGFSPDGAKLALVTLPTQKPTETREVLHVVDVPTRAVSSTEFPGVRPLPTAWHPDGRSVLGTTADRLVSLPVQGGPAVEVAALPGGTRAGGSAWWAPGGRVFLSVSDDRRESLRSWAGGGWTTIDAGEVSGCSAAAGIAACVRQGSAMPPRLTIVDTAKAAARDGYDPNGWFPGVRFPAPEPTAFGYRIRPPGCDRHCPAVVITHGYDARDQFLAEHHEWQYPSQVFAARGYVVLLANESRGGTDPGQAVRTMEDAVRSVVDTGLADGGRVGIMGYSRGAQIAEEALARSTVFRAAAAGEGGSPMLLPGNPFTAERLNGPLLQQMGPATGSLPLSIHDFVRSKGQPAELILFPGETHVFHQPANRAAAMRQNLDWFDRYLSGK